MTPGSWDRVPIAAQTIEATLSQFATFLVLEVGSGDDDLAVVRDTVSGLDLSTAALIGDEDPTFAGGSHVVAAGREVGAEVAHDAGHGHDERRRAGHPARQHALR